MAKSISRYLADISSTTGVLDGTLSTAAQSNITSLGTLSSLTVSGSAAMTLTTAAQPNITSVGTLSTLAMGGSITRTGDLTLDASGKIILDADDPHIQIKDGGLLFGSIYASGSDLHIEQHLQDEDIIFKGNDGGSSITALTLDMSEGGIATFAAKIHANKGVNFYTTDDQANYWIQYTHTDDTLRLNYNGAGNDEVVVTTSGQVGIGETSPDRLFHVKRSDSGGTVAKFENSAGTVYVELNTNNQAGGDAGYLSYDSNKKLGLWTDDAQRVTIDANGKVGIGTQFTGGNASSIMTAPLNVKLTSGSSAAVATFNLEHSSSSANIEQRLQFNMGDDGTADSYSNAGYVAFGKENVYVTDDTRDSYLSFATAANASQAERMRITSAGHVGIADTPPAWGAAYVGLTLGSAGAIWGTRTAANLTVISDNSYHNGSNSIAMNTGLGSIYTQSAGRHIFGAFASVSAGAVQTEVTNMVIDADGNVGIQRGASRLIVGGASNASGLYASTSVSAIGIFGANAYSSCGAHIESATDADSGWAPFYMNKFDWTSGDDARWMSFGVNGYTTDYAEVRYDGTNFSIVNGSDYRLKENIVDYSGGLAKLEELKVRTYNKKEGVSKHITQQGFIAHEAATANIPGFISGEKDAMKVNELGETVPDYQVINKEALIPYLVSAIQELSAKVKELESK